MRKHYSESFKQTAIDKVINHNMHVAQVAEELNIVPQTLYRWLQNHRKNDSVNHNGMTIESNKKYMEKLEAENAILKKSRLIDNSTESIFTFIFANKKDYAITTMCDLLDVSSSGYYRWVKSMHSKEKQRHTSLKEVIRARYIEHGPNIGSPALTDLLHKQNIDISQSTVARILRDNKLDWHIRYSKFHRDDLITLDFPTKNSVWCSDSNVFYDVNKESNAINQMLSSHSFTRLKKHYSEGVHDVSNFNNSDNLIIKGDNLIVLHHLKTRFKNKVQLIYLDPPYNNGNYTTSYLNSYSESTYLTFIKNRLEVSKNLLKDSGTIFIQCTNHNQAYIKTLCDQTFGKDNFVNQLIWRRTESQQNRAHIASVVDYILIYAKDISQVKLNRLPLSDADKEVYKFKDAKGFYRIDRLADNKNGYYQYSITTPSKELFNGTWKYPKTTFLNLIHSDSVHWNKNYPYKKFYLHENEGKIPSDLWTDPKRYGSNQQASKELKTLFGSHKFTFPKPELLMYRIIQLATDKGDIVLDPFLGSATTAAVSHKMSRQYIGIEIMDYVEKLSVIRLKKVISGDGIGISNKINWNSGGSFIYTELKKDRND